MAFHLLNSNQTLIEKNSLPLSNGCWEWQSTISNGYGIISVNSKRWMAHRLAYRAYRNDFDENLLVRHKCNNKKCCNPDHLQLGTYSDNRKDFLETNPVITFKQKIRKPNNINLTNFVEWVFTVVYSNNGCEEYPTSTTTIYPTVSINGRIYKVHRLIYCLTYNLNYNDKSFMIRHLCHNKKCVNLNHLQEGTQSENQIDSRESNKKTLLTKDIVLEIRRDMLQYDFSTHGSKTKFDKLWAEKLNINNWRTIQDVRLGRSWKDINV